MRKYLLLATILFFTIIMGSKVWAKCEKKVETNSLIDTKATVTGLVLEKQVESEVGTEGQPLSLLEDFPLILQNPELPTGCEITALTMLLNYYGYSVDKTVMAADYLPKVGLETHYGNDGQLYGNDLNQFFIGDPYSASGITCGIPALMTAANQYLENENSSLCPWDISGTSPQDLYTRVADGQPVLVLVTISMSDRWDTQGWYTENGSYVDWSQNDHGAVLIGYSDTEVTIADPISGIMEYSRKQFERVYLSRGQQSMVLE